MKRLDRREFMRQVLAVWMCQPLVAAALAGESRRRALLEGWLAECTELARAVKAGGMAPVAWQESMEALYRRLPPADLLAQLDFDRAIAGLEYPADRAAVTDVALPRPTITARVFGLARGCAVVPHAHNDMVSCHLVARGTFRVRTFHRVRDEAGALVLAPSLDRELGAGEVLTMSDDRDNVHWLVATSERAYTLDVPVSGLQPRRSYATAAQFMGMIFVDPRGKPASDGLVRAPVIAPDEAFARFGRSG